MTKPGRSKRHAGDGRWRRLGVLAAATAAAGAGTVSMAGGAAGMDRIVLSITGAPGADFAGTCVVGAGPKEETLRLDGVVPFTVALEADRLACRISAIHAVTVEARKAGNVTRTKTSGGTVNLRLE